MTVLRKRVIGWTGGTNQDGKTRQLSYSVETDDPLDGPDAVEAFVGWSLGDTYAYGNDSSSTIRVTNIDTVPVSANRTEWTETVSFGASETTSNPLSEPTKYSRSIQNREEAIERDTHGAPIRNSAVDRFDDIITREASRTVLSVSKNFLTWPQSYYRLVNTVNRLSYEVQDEVYTRRQMRLSNMSDSSANADILKTVENPAGLYYSVNLEFCFAEDDWDLVLLDQGVRQSYRRWLITHTDSSGEQEVIGGIVYNTRRTIVRAATKAEAQIAFVDANPGAIVLETHQIADGYEPCKEQPPARSGEAGTGKDSQLPMLLDGAGRQAAEAKPTWLKYVGHFEFDFNRFNLS